MAGNNRQRKSSSSSFFSAFNIFKSKNRGGSHYDAYDDGTRARKVWRSDEDNGHHGVAEPGIDMRAEMFIRQYKRRVSESELFQLDPAAIEAQGGGHYDDDAYDVDGTRATRKVWRIDENHSCQYNIDPQYNIEARRAEMFIRQCKKRVSESEIDFTTIEIQ
ncbi:uncharacterized protein G2W53_001664 [Senna tora]|uniref:Uncharacterized protein n=1 Tax=Senna tora TaxID=362788 RepID=A0A834XI47_9FABA|nr:uncharacterized protein G2W53_001664 [Senna tora]